MTATPSDRRDVPAASPFRPSAVGIDVGSRRLALCVLNGHTPYEFYWYETPTSTIVEELNDLRWWLINAVQSYSMVGQVHLESAYLGHGKLANPKSAMRQSMTIAMILVTVGGTPISPMTWKADLLGHGSADKSEIRDWVDWTSPEVTAAIKTATRRADRRQDLYDAYCIAVHGDATRRSGL